jgi:hypothetical protein
MVLDSIGSLFQWFKDNFREPIPGMPNTPRGAATNGTPYNGISNDIFAGINPQAIQQLYQLWGLNSA